MKVVKACYSPLEIILQDSFDISPIVEWKWAKYYTVPFTHGPANQICTPNIALIILNISDIFSYFFPEW